MQPSCFERLLELQKYYPGLQHRLAVAYNGAGRPRAAERCFEKALATPSKDKELTRWEYSHLLLAEGDLKCGWPLYESRYRIEGNGRIAIHPFEYPRWQGEALADKTLLVHGEQGIGDEMMFASLIPALITEGGKIILACHPSLVRLFATSFSECEVVPHNAVGNPTSVDHLGHIDYEVPFCSLSNWRGPFNVNDTPAKSYLKAEPAQVVAICQRLSALNPTANKTKRVGLMWSANPATGVDWGERRGCQKSVPIEVMAALAPLADHIQFVSLQNSDSGIQAAHAPGLDMLDFQDQLLDFADTAALAACMDLVISVDTSVAHLLGGLGVPVWVLLKHHPDWRWLNTYDNSYWYGNAKLYRQKDKGDWDTVIKKSAPTCNIGCRRD